MVCSTSTLLNNIQSCQHCLHHLPHAPKPIVQIHAHAKILIIGQAPGRIAHETGQPFNDRSGDRLRHWLGVSKSDFYSPEKFAIMPMGFCYPGTGSRGDNPPRPECAPLWHPQIREALTDVRLTLLVGRFAIQAYWPEPALTLTSAVQQWQCHKGMLALPHPSPRNRHWLTKNSWFEALLLPDLRAQVALHLTQ